MTANINKTEATASVNETTGEITITVGKQSLKLSADQVTSLTTVALAARKESYELNRVKTTAARTAAKAARTAKQAERAAAATAKREAQIKKLNERLAKLNEKGTAKKAA